MPNFNLFAIFSGNPFPKQCLLPAEAIVVTVSNPIEFMHNEHGPSPSAPSLNVVPKFMFDRFAHVRNAKNTLFGNRSWHNAGPPFINCNRFMPKLTTWTQPLSLPATDPTLVTSRIYSYLEGSPAICHRTGSTWVPSDNGLSSILSGIVKNSSPIQPSPHVQVPSEWGHFAIEEDNSFFFSLLLWSSISVNNFNLMEEPLHLAKRAFLFPKTSWVGAYCETLYQQWQRHT